MKVDNERAKAVCDAVREAGFALHCYLRYGHLEKVYETGLAHRLRKMGLDVKVQIAIEVRDEDGTVLGHFVADLLIEGFLIVEVKAVKAIAAEHEAQLIGYLRATGFEHGALVNFGAPRFWIRKYLLTDEPIA